MEVLYVIGGLIIGTMISRAFFMPKEKPEKIDCLYFSIRHNGMTMYRTFIPLEGEVTLVIPKEILKGDNLNIKTWKVLDER